MNGSIGTGQPLTLKCSQCKKRRNESGTALRGELVRTGRSKPRPRRSAGYPRGHLRIGDTLYECRCLRCGHTGWYAHKGVSYLAVIDLKPEQALQLVHEFVEHFAGPKASQLGTGYAQQWYQRAKALVAEPTGSPSHS